MINFDALLKEKGLTKSDLALSMRTDRGNLYRTLSRYQKILVEIDDFLKKGLKTSLKEQLIGGDVGTNYTRREEREGDGLLNEAGLHYQRLYLESLQTLQRQTETIISQQKTIEALVAVSKKAKSA